jgi:caa(3)-type oxidase subunit IV
MADTHGHAEHAHADHGHGDHGHGEHGHGPNVRAYFMVFGALAVCTLLSFVVNAIFPPPHMTGAGIIMIVAVIKATLVGMIFMHLKWDWSKLYFLIVPSFILGEMMMIVLLPDILLAWR